MPGRLHQLRSKLLIMNTLYFYTDSKSCESSLKVPDCRYFKKILSENTWPYTLIDVAGDQSAISDLRLIVGNLLSLPQFIVRDDSNNLIGYFDSMTIKSKCSGNILDEAVFISQATPLLEEKLKEFQVI